MEETQTRAQKVNGEERNWQRGQEVVSRKSLDAVLIPGGGGCRSLKGAVLPSFRAPWLATTFGGVFPSHILRLT